jgi:hypothetical protein
VKADSILSFINQLVPGKSKEGRIMVRREITEQTWNKRRGGRRERSDFTQGHFTQRRFRAKAPTLPAARGQDAKPNS